MKRRHIMTKQGRRLTGITKQDRRLTGRCVTNSDRERQLSRNCKTLRDGYGRSGDPPWQRNNPKNVPFNLVFFRFFFFFFVSFWSRNWSCSLEGFRGWILIARQSGSQVYGGDNFWKSSESLGHNSETMLPFIVWAAIFLLIRVYHLPRLRYPLCPNDLPSVYAVDLAPQMQSESLEWLAGAAGHTNIAHMD